MLQNYTATVTAKKQLTDTVYQFNFGLLKPKLIIFTPGQYLLLDIQNGFRCYSISSSNQQKDRLEILVDTKPMGLGSKYLLNLKINDPVRFRAPIGIFILKQTLKPKVFLATGVGISPVKAMILNLFENHFHHPFWLLWGLPHEKDIYLQNLWAKIHRENPRFQYIYCLSKQNLSREFCFSGHIQKKLASLNILPDAEFYLCSQLEIVGSIKKFLIKDLRIKPQSIFHENFA